MLLSYAVRIPSLEDFDQINSLGRWFQQNSNFFRCGWSSDKALKFVTSGKNPESNTFMRVCTEEDEIVGFFLGSAVEYFFSDSVIAQEMVVVFKPEHRDNIAPHLALMITDFTEWARQRDAVEVCIGITSGIAGEGYPKFIQSQGFKEAGLIFKKEV